MDKTNCSKNKLIFFYTKVTNMYTFVLTKCLVCILNKVAKESI
jgi:hypothetical protein